ncbi:hypothetical protein WA577_001431, partial [Blastocystis sp. JDR]
MNKPFLFACGMFFAYSIWRLFVYPSSIWPFRKSVEDEDSSSSAEHEDAVHNPSDTTDGNAQLISASNPSGESSKADDSFTIVSSHAYDLSEEEDVASHRDSYNESNVSFVKDDSNEEVESAGASRPE